MGTVLPLRALPRTFVVGARADSPIELPREELDKLRKVLRLSSGAEVAVLPGDGSLIRCILRGHFAEPIETVWPKTEPEIELTVAQALPKGDKIDEIVRACTEIGVARFLLFASERTIVRWDERKSAERLRRLTAIAREASEVSFRTKIPSLHIASDLDCVLKSDPNAIVLSEAEGLGASLKVSGAAMTVVVGPEGGWSPRELESIGERGVSLGPRVLRVDHAAPAAAAILLLRHGDATDNRAS